MPDSPPQPYKTLLVNDFTPGIRQIKSLNHPPGTAQDHEDTHGSPAGEGVEAGHGPSTYGCWSSPADGVLRALPRRAEVSIKRDASMVYAGLVSEQYRICGTFAMDPVFSSLTAPGIDQNNTELWVGIEYYTATDRERRILRYKRHQSTPTWEAISSETVLATFGATARPGRCYFTSSRSNSGTPADPGIPIVVWGFGGFAEFFPDDTTPTVTSTLPIPQGGGLPVDQVIGHQGRVVCFPLFGWGAGTNNVHPDNELIYWTTFNDATTLDPQLSSYAQVVAYPERDTGYEIQASIANDQLLLIKRAGGGLILQGDLNDFVAIPQPGIKSPGFALNRGTQSNVGYLYPSEAGGVWALEGNRSSRNISPYMEPNFWRPRPVYPANPIDVGPPTYIQQDNGWGLDYTGCAQWQQWALFPANWLYDSDTQAWWRLDETPVIAQGNSDITGPLEAHWWCTDWTGRWAWSSPSGYSDVDYNGNDCPVFHEYDRLTAAGYYQWLSHPMRASISNRVEVLDIALTMETFDETDMWSPSYIEITVLADDASSGGGGVTQATRTYYNTIETASGGGVVQTLLPNVAFGVVGTNVRVWIEAHGGSTTISGEGPTEGPAVEAPRVHAFEVQYNETNKTRRSITPTP